MQSSFSAKTVASRIVPITRFNRGEASKVFDEVAAVGTKVVLKNNTPEVYLVSPSEFDRLMEIVEDYELLMEAQERLASGTGVTFTEAEVLQELGITQEDLDSVGEVELE